VEALVRYRKGAFFDDELSIRTELADLSKASLRFEYEILRDGEMLATGHTRHACMNLASGRPSRVPEQLVRVARDEP